MSWVIVPDAAITPMVCRTRVTVFEHRRHRNHAHRDDGCCHRAGDRAKNCSNKNDRVGKATANGPKSWPKEFEKVLCKATPLENGAHEREERDRQQEVVRDDAEQLIGQVAEEIWTDQAEFDTDKSEEQSGCRQRECRRISDEHENNHACEHQGREVLAIQVIARAFRT